MSRLITILFSCVLVFCLFSSSSSGVFSKAPLWVVSVDEAYDSDSLLCAVGIGLDRKEAEYDALSSLAKSIKQNVVAKSDAQKNLVGNDSVGFDSDYDYSASVSAVSTVKDIVGVTYPEVWIDSEGKYYVLAQLNREEAGRFYKKRIEDRAVVIENQIMYSANNDGSFEALAALTNAVDLARQNEEDMSILAGVHADMYRLLSFDYSSAEAVSVLAERQREKIHVKVVVTGDSAERIKTVFSRVLTDSGLIVSNTQEETRYSLNVVIDMTEIEGNEKYEYVRFVVDTSLKDNDTGKILVPYTDNGREAHISLSEATQRAYRTIETNVKKEYTLLLQQYLDSLNQ